MDTPTTEKDVLIDRYLELVINKNRIIETQMEQVAQRLAMMGEALTAEGRKQLKALIEDIIEQSTSQVTRPALEEISTEALAKCVEFLESGAGQAFLRIQPKMQERIHEYVAESFEENIERIHEILDEHTMPVN